MTPKERIEPPWTMEQVAHLNRFQSGEGWPRRMHPFTCGNRDDHPEVGGDKGILRGDAVGVDVPILHFHSEMGARLYGAACAEHGGQ